MQGINSFVIDNKVIADFSSCVLIDAALWKNDINVAKYYSQNEIPATFNNYKSFCMVCNMVLCGYIAETDAAYHNNPELLRLAKSIYKSNTVNYGKI